MFSIKTVFFRFCQFIADKIIYQNKISRNVAEFSFPKSRRNLDIRPPDIFVVRPDKYNCLIVSFYF